eukprot:Opistho-2@43862
MTMIAEGDGTLATPWLTRAATAAGSATPHAGQTRGRRTPGQVELGESPVKRKYSVFDKLSPIEVGPKPLPKNAWKNVSSSGTIPSRGVAGSVSGFVRGIASAGAMPVRPERSTSAMEDLNASAHSRTTAHHDEQARPHTAAAALGGTSPRAGAGSHHHGGGSAPLQRRGTSTRLSAGIPADHMDPDLLEDRLPQPYRMIDKIVSAFLDDVWGTIVRNEEARQTRLQAVSTRRLATCDDVKAIPSTAQVTCIVATPDERWTFAGTKKGSILAINPRQWYSVSSTTVIDEKMSVAVMQVEMMGDCAYVLAVGMKEDGSVRLYGFAETVFVALQSFDGAFPSFKLSSDAEMFALCGGDGQVSFFQLPAKTWAHRVLATGGDDRAGTPTRSHTSLVSAPPQSTRVNQPTFFMRIGAPPEPPLSKAYLSTRAAERSPLGDAPQAQQNSKKLGAPSVHFTREPIRFGGSLTTRDAAQLLNASAAIWWNGSIQVHKYSLLKRTYGPKDLVSPESAWVHPQVIKCSASSECGTLLATGLRNGMIVIWDCILGVKRSISGNALGVRICDLTFCGSAVLVAGMSDGVTVMLDTRTNKAVVCAPPDEEGDGGDVAGQWPPSHSYDSAHSPVIAVVPMPRERMFVSMQRQMGHVYDSQTGRCLGVITLQGKDGVQGTCEAADVAGFSLTARFVDEALVFRGRMSVSTETKSDGQPSIPLFEPTPSVMTADLTPVLASRRVRGSALNLFSSADKSDRSALDASEVRVFSHLERRATAKSDRRRGQRQRDITSRAADIIEASSSLASAAAAASLTSAPTTTAAQHGGGPAHSLTPPTASGVGAKGSLSAANSAPPSRAMSPVAGASGAGASASLLAPPRPNLLRPGSGSRGRKQA